MKYSSSRYLFTPRHEHDSFFLLNEIKFHWFRFLYLFLFTISNISVYIDFRFNNYYLQLSVKMKIVRTFTLCELLECSCCAFHSYSNPIQHMNTKTTTYRCFAANWIHSLQIMFERVVEMKMLVRSRVILSNGLILLLQMNILCIIVFTLIP